MKRKMVTLTTDGSCLDNGKEGAVGAWAAILQYKQKKAEYTGAAKGTTNNRMELMAVIKGLEKLTEPCEVLVITDSAYVCRSLTNMAMYIENGFKTKCGLPPKNDDLLKQLLEIEQKGDHIVKFQFIKGHSGHPGNERANFLATAEANAFQKLMKGE